MDTTVSHVFLTVDDHDKALDYFVGVLGFVKTWDAPMPGGYRWLTVSPDGHQGCNIVLNKAGTDDEKALVGKQSAGDRTPFCILETENFQTVYEDWKAKGVAFTEEPMDMPWGRMVSFRDPYGNLWLLMRSNPAFTEGRID